MKHVDTWLNEKEFKIFKKTADKRGVTPYTLTKNLILQFLNQKQDEVVAKTIVFYFLLYALFATVLVYVF